MGKKLIWILLLVMLLSVSVNAQEEKQEFVDAIKSEQNLSVDGKSVSISAYNIAGNNYFKLRDVANIVSGTEKEFDVGYNEKDEEIVITTNKAYSKVSEGVSKIDKLKAKGKLGTEKINLNSHAAYIDFVNIDGSNYIKLRDIGELVGFTVEYNAQKREIMIETNDFDYIEEKEYNDGDDKAKLDDISLDDVKKISNSLSGEYKFELEEKGDKLKFYLNNNGRKDRFYLYKYTHSNIEDKLYGCPERLYGDDFPIYMDNLKKFIKKINETLDKAGRENLKVTLPVYNYIYFMKAKNASVCRDTTYKPEIIIRTSFLSQDLLGKSANGYDLPLQFSRDNNIGAADTQMIPDSNGLSEDIIHLGKAYMYMIDKDYNKVPVYGEFSTITVDNDAKLFVVEYTVNRIKGRMLVYLVN